MDATLHALGRILLDGVPTALIVLFLVGYLRFVFFGPLSRIYKQRYDETEGARKAAAESIRQAELRIAEYEEKLRAARGEIYAGQDRALREVEREQADRLATARREADAHVARAAAELKTESEQARQTLETRSSELAAEIVDRVLEGRAA